MTRPVLSARVRHGSISEAFTTLWESKPVNKRFSSPSVALHLNYHWSVNSQDLQQLDCDGSLSSWHSNHLLARGLYPQFIPFFPAGISCSEAWELGYTVQMPLILFLTYTAQLYRNSQIAYTISVRPWTILIAHKVANSTRQARKPEFPILPPLAESTGMAPNSGFSHFVSFYLAEGLAFLRQTKIQHGRFLISRQEFLLNLLGICPLCKLAIL